MSISVNQVQKHYLYNPEFKFSDYTRFLVPVDGNGHLNWILQVKMAIFTFSPTSHSMIKTLSIGRTDNFKKFFRNGNSCANA